MQHEQRVAGIIHHFLEMYGFVATDPSNRVWKRGARQVIVCLADDYNVCGAVLSNHPSQWYNNDTTVITDNHITFLPEYQVIQLPVTYFGIFYYQPKNIEWDPDRRFNFSVNRCDNQRQQIFFELLKQSNGLESCLATDFVNFNGWNPIGQNQTQQDLKDYFNQQWQSNQRHAMPDEYYNVINNLPIKNHMLSFEQVQISAWLNIVIETYAGDVTHAFSEKIFRALVTPALWVVFSGRNAVEYLRQLGFDVLDDIVCHNYDTLHSEDKIPKFIKSSIQNYQNLVSCDLLTLQDRCAKSAKHNQALLLKMHQAWPSEFVACMSTVLSQLQ
jgi:hypothetical protein